MKKEELFVVKCMVCYPATCQHKSSVKIRRQVGDGQGNAAELCLCNYFNSCDHQSDMVQVDIDLEEF